MPGKRSRGGRKRSRSTSARAPRVAPRHLLEQAREVVASGDGRKALDLVRQARDRDQNLAGLPLVSFCACSVRARQLAAKGMDAEAAAMRARAARHRPSISLAALGDDDWVLLVRSLDGADALAAYADHVAHGSAMPRVEQALADALVLQRCWAGLDALAASHPLRRDGGVVRSSLGAMDAGDWERAAGLLRDVPRRSPFAPWRLFSKAMACFNAGDDDGLRRALDHLPPDFALARTVAECRRLVADGGSGAGDAGGASGPLAGLGGDRAGVAALAQEVKRTLRKGNVRALGTAIEKLADAVYPEDPGEARLDLLEVAALAAVRDVLPVPALEGLAERLVPPDRFHRVLARTFLLGQEVTPELWNPTPAVALLQDLTAEFPGPRDRDLARACILESLARRGRAAIDPETLPLQHLALVASLLGRPIDNPASIFGDLMTASLEADPDNRDGYLFLLDLLREQGATKPRRMRVLLDMAERFPDDPGPWLQLAGLHYSRNAYRRAERALAEAHGRAPYDDRFLDLQAVGFLKSADQSRNKGRLALAAQDLGRAEDLGREIPGLVLPAKRLLLEIATGEGEAAATVQRHLEPLPPAVQLRTLALLIRDLDDNRHVRNLGPKPADDLWGLLEDKAELIAQCGPEEIARLLDPLPVELDILYDDRQIAPIFTDWWPKLLRRVDGERLPAVLDVLMGCDGRAEARAELERRLRGVRKAKRDPVLELHLAVLRYADGSDHDSRRFTNLLNRVDAATRARLRPVANGLARHVQGPLRQALLTFDFEPLDEAPLAFGPALPTIIEALARLGGGELEIDDLLPGPVGPGRPGPRGRPDPTDPRVSERFRKRMIGSAADAGPERARQATMFDREVFDDLDSLEEMIDANGLRGEPVPVLKDVAGNLRAEPAMRQELDRIARDCEAAGLRDRLTPELHALLFPRASKKKKRR
ncbi:MAG: hypothetical protein OXH04_18850 [Acidobacteria bacterium]|nr:hypothetical protein [Acidobacteriota bacterium]